MPIFFTKKYCNKMPLTVNVGKQKGEPKLVRNPRVGGTKALHTMPKWL